MLTGMLTTISGVCDGVRLSAHFSGILVFHTGVGVTLSCQSSRSPTPQLDDEQKWIPTFFRYVVNLNVNLFPP